MNATFYEDGANRARFIAEEPTISGSELSAISHQSAAPARGSGVNWDHRWVTTAMKAGFIKYHRAVLGILRQAVFSAPAEFGTNGGPAMRNADAFGRDQAGAAVLGSLLFGARGSSAEKGMFQARSRSSAHYRIWVR